MKKTAKKSKGSKAVKPAKKVLKKALKKIAKPLKVMAKPKAKEPSKAAKLLKAAAKVLTKAVKREEIPEKVSKKPLKKGQTQPAQVLAPQKPEEEVVLTNADGKEYCRVHDCDSVATTDGHCRFHYLALWKRNKIKAKILQGGKLDKYIEDLTSKYPDKYLEMLRKDLSSEKDFNVIVAEMDVEDSAEDEQEEDTSRFVEEIRGGIPTPDDDEGGF